MRATSGTFATNIMATNRTTKCIALLDFGPQIDPPYAIVTASSTKTGYYANQVADGRYLYNEELYEGTDVPAIYSLRGVGWKGTGVSNASGVLVSPEVLTLVYDENAYIPADSTNFWVVGHPTNYPVDFLLERKIGEDWETIVDKVGNTEWFYSIIAPADETWNVRLTITKISRPLTEAHIMECGIVSSILFTATDITEMHGIEETFFDNGTIGRMLAGEFSLTVTNRDGRFTSTNTNSPFYGLMKPQLRIRPYAGVMIDSDEFGEEYEVVPMGVFYNQTWEGTDFNSSSFTMRGYDVIDLLHNYSYPTTFGIYQTTVLQHLTDVLAVLEASSELPTGLVVNNITTVYNPNNYSYFMGDSLREFLELVLVYFPAMVKVSRLGVVELINFNLSDGAIDAVWTDQDLVVETKTAQLQATSYSIISLKQHRLKPIYNQLEIDIKEVVVPAATLEDPYHIVRLTSSRPILNIASIMIFNNSTNRIKAEWWQAGSKEMHIALENTGVSATVAMQVYINTLEDTIEEKSTTDAIWYADFQNELTLDCPFYQIAADCNDIRSTLITDLAQPDRDIQIENRINPAHELHDVIEVTDSTNNITDVHVRIFKQEWRWDGSFSGKTTGRVVG